MENQKYKPGIGFIIYEIFIIFTFIGGEEDLTVKLGSIAIMTAIGYAFSHSSWKKKMKIEAMPPEEKEAYYAKLAEKKAQKEAKQQQLIKDQRKRTTIVSAQILDNNHKYKTKGSVTSAALRGAVGGALLGPAGAVVGVATHKKKTVSKGATTRFLIEYADGHKDTKEVKVNSAEYKKLIQYL